MISRKIDNRKTNQIRKILCKSYKEQINHICTKGIDERTQKYVSSIQNVIQRAWCDLEGKEKSIEPNIFDNSWDRLFCKINYLKSVSIPKIVTPPLAFVFWEAHRQLLIARVMRNANDLVSLEKRISAYQRESALRFNPVGQQLISSILVETLIHIYDLVHTDNVAGSGMKISLSDLKTTIEGNINKLLKALSDSYSADQPLDDMNFPVYSLPFIRIINLFEERFIPIEPLKYGAAYRDSKMNKNMNVVEKSISDRTMRYTIRFLSDCVQHSPKQKAI